MSSNSTDRTTISRAGPADGRAWVWLADGLGLTLLVSLLSAAGSGLVGAWLLPGLIVAAVAGIVLCRLSPRDPEETGDGESEVEVPRVVTVTICPRPSDRRVGEP